MNISELQFYIGDLKHPSKFSKLINILGIIGNGEISTALKYSCYDPQIQNIIICGSFFLMPEAKGYFEP